MFSQIFLGIWMIIVGAAHLLKLPVFVGKSVKDMLNEEEIIAFQRGLVIPFFLLGVIFITMGFVEKANILNTVLFIAIYIISGAVPLTMILRHQKKLTGYYFPWG